MKKINSKNNDFIRYAKSLFIKKYRDRYNQFLVIGEKNINIFSENFVCLHLISNLSVLLEKTHCVKEKYLVDKILFNDYIKNYKDNFIFAIFKKDTLKEALTLENDIVILNNIQDPYNLGSILRTLEAFNIQNIILDNEGVDLYNPKVISAVKNSFVFKNIIIMDKTEIINILKKMPTDYELVFCKKADSSEQVYDIKNNINKKFVLVFGNEGSGIGSEYLFVEHQCFWLPINSHIESLNVSCAVSIITWIFVSSRNEV